MFIHELENKITPAQSVLKQYLDLLIQWQKAVNLVSPNTIKDAWNRHVLDSAQLYFLLPQNAKILMDVGSGGGLPGIIIAILNKALQGALKKVILVESDLKKSLFLKECVRSFNLENVEVIRDRVENIQLQPDIITARAFAPLGELLSLVKTNVSRETILLLPKGKSVEEEIQNNPYKCHIEKIENCVNSDGYILKIGGVQYE